MYFSHGFNAPFSRSEVQVYREFARVPERGDAFVVEAEAGGGAEGVLVTAVAPEPFSQGVGMLARGGTMSLVGLPPDQFPLDIFDTVLSRKTIRGSIVGTRNDLAESLAFAAEGKVKAHFDTEPLDNINDIFDRMRSGSITGHIAMDMAL